MSSIATSANPYTAQLRAHERRTKAEITAAHTHLKEQTTPVFARLVKQLTEAQASEQRLGVWWLYENNRLQQVLDRVHAATGVFAAHSAHIIHTGHKQAISIGAASALAQLKKRIKTPHVPNQQRQNGDEEERTVYLATMPQDTHNRVRDAILLAASLGITLAMLEMLLQKAIDRLLWLAIGLDVNEEYDAFRDTLLIWYQANSDTIEAWQWVTAEDERVCFFCESMDGTIHDLSESLVSHPNCRCEMDPYFIQPGDILAIA